MIHYNIIARTNGVGLDRDVSLIKDILVDAGHKVTLSHRKEKSFLQRVFNKSQQYDVNIFIERIYPNWIPFGKKNVLIPNQERFPHRHVRRLKRIDLVLTKSLHAEEIFSKLGCETKFTSFSSKDVNSATIEPDYSRFIHLAGKSTMKGTETILDLWERHPEWPSLTLIQCKDHARQNVPKNVNLITDYLDQATLEVLLNEHGIHLCPSSSEGWGHYIVEAMSTGGVVVTTDAPPMNEIIGREHGILIPYKNTEPRHLGTNYYVDENKLGHAISLLVTERLPHLESMGSRAKVWYADNDSRFKERFLEAIN